MSNKSVWITAGVIVLAIIVGVVIYESTKTPGSSIFSMNGSDNSVGPTPSGTVTPTPTPTPTPVTVKPTPTPTQAYLDLVKKFDVLGHRIQFVSCHAVPASLQIKKGLQFMLDNRDDVAQTIKFNNQSFTLAPYGYTVATATNMGDYNSTCNGNAAGVVTVEK